MIPDEIRRFLLSSVPSVAYLEAALLFHRDPRQHHSARDVARVLYIADAAAEALLESLQAAGVISVAGDAGSSLFHYAPRDEALAGVFDQLAQLYRTEMIGVTHLIHDSTQRSARRFADVFKLRKDP